jgi:hypothetical protein
LLMACSATEGRRTRFANRQTFPRVLGPTQQKIAVLR